VINGDWAYGGFVAHLLFCALVYYLVKSKGYDWPVCLLAAIFGCVGIFIALIIPYAPPVRNSGESFPKR
jgi:hypothetical protein